MKRLLLALAAFGILIGEAASQTPPTVRPCYGSPCVGVSTTNPFPVNATITPSGTQNTNLVQLNSVALGSPSAYGTSPGAVNVLGVNAFVTNFPATQPVSGTVTANQGTSNATPWNENISQISGVAANSVSTVNSTTALLGNGGVFTGTSEDISAYASVTISLFADQASATNGLSIQQSSNGTNWDIADVYTIAASTGKTFGVQVAQKFLRVVYTNGATPQGAFRLQTIMHGFMPTTSSQRPSDAISNENDFQENLAFGMQFNGTTWDRSRGDSNFNLLVSSGGAPSLATAQASVTTGNISVAAARTGRRSVKITNVTGTSAIFCGNTGVTTSTGDYIGATAGSNLVFNTSAAIFCTVAVTTQTVAVAETF